MTDDRIRISPALARDLAGRISDYASLEPLRRLLDAAAAEAEATGKSMLLVSATVDRYQLDELPLVAGMLRVVPHVTRTNRRATSKSPAMDAGVTVYVLRHDGPLGPRYFRSCYVHRDAAVEVAEVISASWRKRSSEIYRDMDYNFVDDPEHSVHSHVTLSEMVSARRRAIALGGRD